MDRDIATKLVTVVKSLAGILETIDHNLYSAHIITQPTDQYGAIGTDVTFTVEATNVKKYQWQYKQTESGGWKNSTLTGYNTASITYEVTSARLGYAYRCQITGLDNEVITTNAVHMYEPV